MIRAGRLRHRVSIQALAIAQDASGDTAPSEVDDGAWETLCTRWAAIEPLVGRELLRSNQELAKGTCWVRLRNIDAVTSEVAPDMRVVFGTRVYNIKSVQRVNEMRGEMWLLCEEQL